jgi:BirA family biotin operon repressor/biotin-[acetyl-CoA-carboxylase] ligase
MNIIWLDTIDSTNSEALRRLAELPSMTVLAAREQTAGRGQRGNTWFTEPGKNLTFSIVVKFAEGQLHASQVHWLNYLMSDVVSMFLRSYGIDCTIKWPNDVYVQRRKICGILIENTLKGEWVDAAVIGTGININQREFPQLASATSLWRCLGEEFSLEECLDRLSAAFEDRLPDLFDAQARGGLFSNYSGRLFNKDVQAHYHDYLTEREYVGVIQGVEPDGRLCIRDLEAPGKPYRYYRFKEVGYIL